MPNFWEQLFYLAIIGVSMMFGAHLFNRRHASSSDPKKPQAMKRPRKKR